MGRVYTTPAIRHTTIKVSLPSIQCQFHLPMDNVNQSQKKSIMKTRFSTLDIVAAIPEIQQRLAGMRVVNCYDIDNKTYLIKLQKPDFKGTLLFESGSRLHLTEFEWPKNTTPSGFAMKLRKHLRGRRLEKMEQLGIDRIVDMQFGSGEAAYHVILELYDRGNIVLTDFEYTILNILRPRTDESQDVRFAVREKYPLETARQPEGAVTEERLRGILLSAKEGDNLRKVLNPHLVYGPALIEHTLRGAGLQDNAQIGKQFNLADGIQLQQLLAALHEAENFLQACKQKPCKGIVIQKKEKKADSKSEEDVLMTNTEFHPALFRQHEMCPYKEFPTFNQAVDEFFSQIGTQKLDMKALQMEKNAIKKLENVKRDHEKRLDALQKEQEFDTRKGQLIEMNLPLVDRAITVVRSAVANQIDWTEIQGIVKEAQSQGDQVAECIKGLKLDTNHITLLLRDIYLDEDEEGGKPIKVDIDLGLSAYANARKYFDMKRTAAKKEQKTIDASSKALKSAEKKTKQTLKDVATSVKINKARKTYWFEKFLWFISSENYLVIGGRDQQQNEVLVKRYLRPGDLYVHADLHGASSVIIKNPTGEPVPPKTLNEAGTMAVCNSAAWDAKVVTSAWWVSHHQVSKTAPTGEYLTTGSFMIRGKKNFLPPCYLIYGFAFLFKVDEDSVERHRDERKVRIAEEGESEAGDTASQVSEMTELDEGSLDLDDGSDASEDDEGTDLSVTAEDVQSPDEESSVPVTLGDVTVDMKTRQDSEVTHMQSVKCERTETDDSSTDSQFCISDTGISSEKTKPCDVVKKEESVVSEKQSYSDEDEEFPDTAINLQHIEGDKFTLQRFPSQSTASVTEDDSLQDVDDTADIKKGGRLSAKQRRQMRKKGQLPSITTTLPESTLGTTTDSNAKPISEEREKEDTEGSEVQLQPQLKRRQKAKQKKIKAKYQDQDEEERQLRMEILASAGEKKEDKKKGKKNKQKQQQQQQGKQKQQAHQQHGKPGPKEGPWKDPDKPVGIAGAMEELKIGEGHNKTIEEADPANPGAEDDQEEEEQPQGSEDTQALQSLTGQPHPEDSLLFCMPVCAPYSALLNYKYKVKLIPGTTKRGKAAKLAHHMFLHDKTATPAEKDLLRCIKDDMSRNIPGKVKVAAQGISKMKTKTKK